MRKLALLFLLFVSFSVYAQNQVQNNKSVQTKSTKSVQIQNSKSVQTKNNKQGKSSDSEKNIKKEKPQIQKEIDLVKTDVNLIQEKVNDLKKESDTYKLNYEHRNQQQEAKIRDVYKNISIYLLIAFVFIVLAGLFGYWKIKKNTQKVVQEKLDDIKQFKEDIRKIFEDAEKRQKQNLEKIENSAEKNIEYTRNIEKIENNKSSVELKKAQPLNIQPTIQSINTQPLDEKTEQEVSYFVEETNSTNNDLGMLDNLTELKQPESYVQSSLW